MHTACTPHAHRCTHAAGTGTYFASAFEHFLKHVLRCALTDVAATYVVFPDEGAHRRFYTMVRAALGGEMALSNILYIEKSRCGTEITQACAAPRPGHTRSRD